MTADARPDLPDDAVHAMDPETHAPLCRTPWHPNMNLRRLYEPAPDWGEGCWTCILKARELRDAEDTEDDDDR